MERGAESPAAVSLRQERHRTSLRPSSGQDAVRMIQLTRRKWRAVEISQAITALKGGRFDQEGARLE